MKNRNTSKARRLGRKENIKRALQPLPAKGAAIYRSVGNVYGFPDRMRTTLRYADTFAVPSITGAVGKQAYRCNSVYDPDYTNAGHQPLYYDTYAAIYDHYAVISSKIRVEVINANTTTWMAGLVIDDDTTTSSDIKVLLEQNHGVSDMLTPLTGSHSEAVFTDQFNAKSILGIDPFASQTYKTGIASNPSEESYFLIWGADLLGSGTTYMQIKVEIIYDVLFTELSTPNLS